MAARPAVLLLAVELILFSASNSAGCKQALGLQDGGIKNEAITASSWKDDIHKPQFARLNSEKAWCSGNETSPYLQISLSEVHKITGIATQGSLRDKQWVTEYEIHYTTNASGWKVHKASNGKQIFQGNSHFQRTSRHKFCVPLIANAIRIFPTKAISRSSGFTEFCLRVEIYGCKEVKCGDPGVPTHGRQEHVSNNYRFGGSVIFACDASYRLVGNKAITCLKDKNWSGKAPQCVGLCSDPGQPNNGMRMDHNFSLGQVVRFRCNPYLLRKGPRAIKCQDGIWDGPVPQCSDCAATLQNTREDQSSGGITLTLREATLITGLKLKMKAKAPKCKLYLKLQIHEEKREWKTFYSEEGRDKLFQVNSGTSLKHLSFKEPFIAQQLRLKCLGKKKPDLESVTLVGCKDIKGFFDCILVGSKVWVSANTDKRTVYKQEYVHKIQNEEVKINPIGTYIKNIVPDIIASRNMLTPGTRVIAKDGGTFYGGTVKREMGNSLWEIESNGVVWASHLNNIRIIEQPKYCPV